jgi:hypothetical protein
MSKIFSAKIVRAITPRISKNAALLASAAALALTVSQGASAAVMTFNDAVLGSDFSHYVEGGFTADVNAGNWVVGRYHPFVYFLHNAGEAPTAHTISVANGGALFKFSSVDLYSSMTVIPYTVTGFRNNSQVFSIDGVVPNTFGNFRTVGNTFADQQIDRLSISLTNPELFFGPNPIGIDNIVTAPVPEPETYGMMIAGLMGLAALRHRQAK